MAERTSWPQASEFEGGLCGFLIFRTQLEWWALENSLTWLMLAGRLGAVVLSKDPSSCPQAFPEHCGPILPPQCSACCP